MSPIRAIFIMALFSTPSSAQQRAPTAPWVSDQGDGTYANPVLFADYSDPDIVRAGSDYYLTSSSFSMVPGLPILQSRDLINWRIINHAIERMPDRFNTPQSGNGIWAPSFRYHNGWFWIFVGDPDWGILMLKTKDPAGKWEPIHVTQEGKGLIDPCPLWDDDGKAYLVHAYANSRAGRSSIIVVREMSPDGTKLIGEETIVIDGRNNVHPTIEGPKFYKRNGWYYIFAPAGGVTRGYQLVARSRNVRGPYEVKKTLEQGSTEINGPHQGGWVTTPGPSTGSGQGEDWFMHFQDRGGYGRIVHLQPMRWVDDWPVMGVDKDGNGIGEPVLVHRKPDVGMVYPVETPATTDEFNGNALGLQWQWTSNPRPEWASLLARPGWLRMNATPKPSRLTDLPSQLLQKFPAPKFTATTRVELSDTGPSTEAGLVVMGPSYAAIVVSRGENGLQVQRLTSGTPGRGGAATQPDQASATVMGLTGPIWLRVSVEPEAQCTFSFSTDGEIFNPLGEAFPARGAAGTWMGSRMGLFCTGENGHADFEWFRVER